MGTAPSHVTRNQFARGMGMLGFKLTEQQLDALCRHYCGTEFKDEFNYVNFTANVDPDNVRLKGASVAVREKILEHNRKKVQHPAPPTFANPYYDKSGRVRPLASRPQSAPGQRSRANTAQRRWQNMAPAGAPAYLSAK